MMFMFEYQDTAWWYWLATAILLTTGLVGYENGYLLAIALTIIHTIHYLYREGNLEAFPVQVRSGYLVLLLSAWPDHLQLIYWIPAIGTWAQVIFGYCAMARFLSLFPWNRDEPFSIRLLAKAFLSRPVRGSVLQGFAEVGE